MENSREKNSLERTYERQDSATVIRQWLVTFGELTGRQITSALVQIWIKELSNLPPGLIDRLFQRHMKTSRFFPMPGDITGQMQETKKKETSELAEIGWQKALDHAREWTHPDMKFSRAPKLDEKIDRAARAAGGFLWIRECPTEDLQWARKRFIEAYERLESLEGEQFLIENSEIKNLFAEAARKMELPESVVEPKKG